MVIRHSSFPVFFLLLLPLASHCEEQKNLYDEWLQGEGYYLTTQDQKDYFRKLTDVEKEGYIRNLWASLDSDPVTPENEFQIEFRKRLAYAKENFGIPSDRAKIYILLGPPNTIEHHVNSDKYYPLELWSYFSLSLPGLPPSLELIFFKPWGVGPYRLYSPAFDGFKALTPSQIDLDNVRNRSRLKMYFDPQVVEAAEQVTPGASPNKSEEIRMALQSPDALLKIEKKRPQVETTVVYQNFEADLYVYPAPQEDGTFRTGFALAIPPKYLTFEQAEGNYRGRVDLIGKISDEKGNQILNINDSPSLKLSPQEFERAKEYLFSYLFEATLLPGKYNMDCLFRDYLSNTTGRVEQTFEIPPVTGEMELLPPLIAYKSVPEESGKAPFSFDGKQYFPKENASLSNGQTMNLYTRLLNPDKLDISGEWTLELALKNGDATALRVTEQMPIDRTAPSIDIARKWKIEDVPAGSYILSVRLSKAGTVLASETPLRITRESETLGRIRLVPPDSQSPADHHANLALQYLLKGRLTEAALHARMATDFDPSSYAARSLAARIEEAQGNVKEAIAAYEKLLKESPGDSEGQFLVGIWRIKEKDWAGGVERLSNALALGTNTTELLNHLARAQLQLGRTGQAIESLEKSLALNGDQPEIRELLARTKK